MADVEDVWLAVDEMRSQLGAVLEQVASPPEPEKRRTIRKDDILASLLAAQAKGSPEHHSVLLKTNAKGEVQMEVTVRAQPGSDFETPAQAFAEASRLLVQARETFGLAGIAVTPPESGESGGKA